MKTAYNNMLDAKELPRGLEGLRIHNNHLCVLQQLRKLARFHMREWRRKGTIHNANHPLIDVSTDSDFNEWRQNQFIRGGH